jgi:hypothetical protein
VDQDRANFGVHSVRSAIRFDPLRGHLSSLLWPASRSPQRFERVGPERAFEDPGLDLQRSIQRRAPRRIWTRIVRDHQGDMRPGERPGFRSW